MFDEIMGELVRYLSKISRGYNIYVVVVINRYGNVAEKVIDENFERLAFDIGEEAVVSKLMSEEGIRETEEKFGIGYKDLRPILVITQNSPKRLDKRNASNKDTAGKNEGRE
jgi:hypothetical protein